MTSENKARERIWLGRDARYVGSPWLRLASCFDDEEEDGETQEYVRSDLFEASAAMCSRSNEQIDTLRAELAAEKEKSARLVEALTAIGDLETVSAAEFKSRHPKLNAALDEVGRDQWFVELSWFAHDAIGAYEVKP